MSRAAREEVENARMKGILPPERDKNGQLVNPHIPAFMSAVPIWMKSDSDGPSLQHQRLEKAPEKSTEYEKKRDPYARYDPKQYREVIRRYERLEKERERVLKEAKESGKADEASKPESDEQVDMEQELQRYSEAVKMNVRNLRKREDTAKYLLNLSTAPEFFYDGKARSMRSNPFPNSKPGEHEYEGDLMYEGTGEAPQLVSAQAFAFDAQQHGVDTHVFATPTALSLMMTDHDKKKEEAKKARARAIQEAYGSSGAAARATDGSLRPAGSEAAPGALSVPRSLLMGQSGAYVEYDAEGRPVVGGGAARSGSASSSSGGKGKGQGTEQSQGPARSKWPEDRREFGHRAVWGSWCCPVTRRWGYACCFCSERGAPCAGLAGRAAWRLAARLKGASIPGDAPGALEAARARRRVREQSQGGVTAASAGAGAGTRAGSGADAMPQHPRLNTARSGAGFDGEEQDEDGPGGSGSRGPSLAEQVREARARGEAVPEVGSFREAARKEVKEVWGTKGGRGGDADGGLDGGASLGQKRGGAVLGNAAIDLGGGRGGQALLDSIKDSDDKFRNMGGAARSAPGLDRSGVHQALEQEKARQRATEAEAGQGGTAAGPRFGAGRELGQKAKRGWAGREQGGAGGGGDSSSEEEEDDGTSGAARRIAAKRRRKAIRDAVRRGLDPETAARRVDGAASGSGDGRTAEEKEAEMLLQRRPEDPMAQG